MNHEIICGKSEEVLKEYPDNTFDSCVTDAPYEISFFSSSWDKYGIAFNVDFWSEVYRVMKPGAHILVFGGTRTYHRMTCAVEDAGFEIRDSIVWLYASGFPKSLSIEKVVLRDIKRYIYAQYNISISEDKWRMKSLKDASCVVKLYLKSRTKVGMNTENGNIVQDNVLEKQKAKSESSSVKIAGRSLNALFPTSRSMYIVVEDVDLKETQSLLTVKFVEKKLGNQYPRSSLLNIIIVQCDVKALRNELKTMHLKEEEVQKILLGKMRFSNEIILHVTDAEVIEGWKHITSNQLKHILNLDMSFQMESPIAMNAITTRYIMVCPITYMVDMPIIVEINNEIATIYLPDELIGQGSAIKPAHETIVLARKPISEKNIAANVLKWSTGSLNIDGCRVSGTTRDPRKVDGSLGGNSFHGYKFDGRKKEWDCNRGRFPSNVILECACRDDELIETECSGSHSTGKAKENSVQYGGGYFGGGLACRSTDYTDENGKESYIKHTNPDCICKQLDDQSGEVRGSRGNRNGSIATCNIARSMFQNSESIARLDYNDTGGCSRFFYQAKASQKERWFYCTKCEKAYPMKQRDSHIHDASANKKYEYIVFHPTVKPLSLIEYLVRLITPPGGTILDPFAGTGTLLIAAEHEGFNSVNIDSNLEYCKIAYTRGMSEGNGKLVNDVNIEKVNF